MSGDLKQKLTRPSIWLRLVYMIILAIAFNIAEIIIFAVVVFQFFMVLFTRNPNEQFTRFGRNLARYVQQIVAYLTFSSEEKPFPFASWPDEPDARNTPTENDKPTGSAAASKETDVANKAASPRKPAPRKSTAKRKPPKSS